MIKEYIKEKQYIFKDKIKEYEFDYNTLNQELCNEINKDLIVSDERPLFIVIYKEVSFTSRKNGICFVTDQNSFFFSINDVDIDISLSSNKINIKIIQKKFYTHIEINVIHT